MKYLICLSLGILASLTTLLAQTPIDKNMVTSNGQKIFIEANYANVHITTTTKNEISIKGMVKINNGANDDAYELTMEQKKESIYIISDINNYDRLPHLLMYERNGKKSYEKINKEEDSFMGTTTYNSEGKNGETITRGVIVEIDLHISVPNNITLDIESIYGKVTLKGFEGPLRIDNTYGAVDAIFSEINRTKKTDLRSTYNHVDISIPKTTQTALKLSSSYGEIFTDLAIEVEKDAKGYRACKASTIRAVLNGGGSAKLDVEATYNNIYLRETKY